MDTAKKGLSFFSTIAFTAAIVFVATPSFAFAASGGAAFFAPTPVATPAHTAVELNQLFQKGVGPYDEATMKDKVFPYPLPRNGQFNNPLYNGCYDRKGTRLRDLDPNLSCATAMGENPGKAIFRLFLGYKISCTGGTVGGLCSNAQLLLNCEYKQVQVGAGTLESASAVTRYCSNESGILRSAQGSSTNNAAINGCGPGEDGSGYVPDKPCVKCASGTFNANYNPNVVPCQTCASVAPSPLPSGVASIGGWTSPVGATSAAACRPTGVTCDAGYHVSTDTYSCEPNGNCPIVLNLSPKNPSATVPPNPTSTDGQITANASGANGTPSIVITSPINKAPSNTGMPAIFDGLSANTYTVTASDNSCSTSAQITLTEMSSTPSCGSCPTGSTLSGTNCVQSPTTSPSYVQYQYTCQGAGGCTTQPCHPTCTQGSTFGQISSSNTSPATCGDSSLWVSFGGSCSKENGPTTIPGSQSCPSGFSLVAGSCSMACTPSPTPTPTGCPYSPPMNIVASATGTTVTANLSNNVGTLTLMNWMIPAFGTWTVSGSKGQMLTGTAVPAGTYSIGATDPANTMCQASTSVTVTSTPPSSIDCTCHNLCSPTDPSCPNVNPLSSTTTCNQLITWEQDPMNPTMCREFHYPAPGYGPCDNAIYDCSRTTPRSVCPQDSSGGAQYGLFADLPACTPTPSPTPSPTGPPPCNVATTVATSTLHVGCSYTCGSSNWPTLLTRAKNIAVGERCDSPSAIARVQATGCNSPTVTSCYSGAVSAYSGVYETCSTAYTCPSGKHKEFFWDAGSWSPYGTAVGSIYTCAHSSGATSIYASCVDDGASQPPELYSCSQGYKARYYPAGTPYCIE